MFDSVVVGAVDRILHMRPRTVFILGVIGGVAYRQYRKSQTEAEGAEILEMKNSAQPPQW